MNAAIEGAARRYASAGRIAVGFARGKLRHDPVYGAVLALGIGAASSIVDLGCGRGYLFAFLLASTPDGERHPALHGIEQSERQASIARQALRGAATIVAADLATAPIPACCVATILDVLHYLDAATQESLLLRVRAALAPHGRLLMREADADGGPGFLAVRASERLLASLRGKPGRSFVYRSAGEWTRLLERTGFDVGAPPIHSGPPFANVLLQARIAR